MKGDLDSPKKCNHRKESDITETQYVLKYINTEEDDLCVNLSYNNMNSKNNIFNDLKEVKIPAELSGKINETIISPIEIKKIQFNQRLNSNFFDANDLQELN